jgi:dipeptidyl aminopeptidase/acylaminoacyl peptidase
LDRAASRLPHDTDAIAKTMAIVDRRRRLRRALIIALALLLPVGSFAILATTFAAVQPSPEPVASAPASASPSVVPSSELPTTSPSESIAPPAGVDRIVAITAQGDVLAIDAQSKEVLSTLFTIRPSRDPDDTGLTTHAIDVEVTPRGGLFVPTCCEPAAGAIYVVDPDGKHTATYPGFGIAVHTASGKMAIAEIDDMAVFDSIDGRGGRAISLGAASAAPPESPAWSLDGSRVAYVAGGALYVVDVTASSLDEAVEVRDSREGTWLSPAFTRDGLAAVRSSGEWRGIGSTPDGAASIVLVELESEPSVLAESSTPILSFAASPDGLSLLWVNHAGINWTDGDGDGVHRIPGDFVAATWVPTGE